METKPHAWLWMGDAAYADNVRMTGKITIHNK